MFAMRGRANLAFASADFRKMDPKGTFVPVDPRWIRKSDFVLLRFKSRGFDHRPPQF